MKTILVSGLCLQGNKGGPALALSLRKLILESDPNINVVLLITPGRDFIEEKKWADIYGFDLVEDVSLKEFLTSFKGLKKTARLITKILDANALISMNGVSYVGPPVGQQYFASIWSRYRLFLLSTFAKTPFIGWTQSYGPFNNPAIRFMAKHDFSSQEVIFCRGQSCVETVTQLNSSVNAMNFPDVAIMLDYEAEEGRELVKKHLNVDVAENPMVTISPSAVLYSKSEGEGVENKHVQFLLQASKYFNSLNFDVVLIPHTYRVGTDSPPELCDFQVAKLIKEASSDVKLLKDNLSPSQLKSIISNAKYHIGGRYHSIVASLSSAVPTISLSWHEKYGDLMNQYQQNEMVYEGTEIGEFVEKFKILEETRVERVRLMKQAQEKSLPMLHENSKIMFRMASL